MMEKKNAALNLDEMDQLAGGMGTPVGGEFLEPLVVLDEGPICRYPDGSQFAGRVVAEGVTPLQRAEHLSLRQDIPQVADYEVAPASNLNALEK